MYIHIYSTLLVCLVARFLNCFTFISNASMHILQHCCPEIYHATVSKQETTQTNLNIKTPAHKTNQALILVPYPTPQGVGGGEATAQPFEDSYPIYNIQVRRR